MPAILNTGSEEERQLRVRVSEDHRRLVGAIRDARSAHLGVQKTTQRLQELQSSRSPVRSAPARVKWPVLLCVPAAYVIDVLLMGPSAEYLASMSLSEYPHLVQMSRFVLPVAVLLMELFFAYMIAEAHEAWTLGLGPRRDYVKWMAFALPMALATPLLSLALALSSMNDQPPLIRACLLAAQLLLSAGPHLMVVLGCGQQVRAIVAIGLQGRERRVQAELDTIRQSIEERHSNVARAFNEFGGNLAQIQTLFPGTQTPVYSFSPEERAELRCVNEGQAVVEESAVTPPRGQEPAPSPRPPRPDPGPVPDNGDPDLDDYLQRVLRRRQADDDGAVT